MASAAPAPPMHGWQHERLNSNTVPAALTLLCLLPFLTPLQCVAQLEVVRSACHELQGCSSFSKLLQAVLELGNHLNHVSWRPHELEGTWGGGHMRWGHMRWGAHEVGG